MSANLICHDKTCEIFKAFSLCVLNLSERDIFNITNLDDDNTGRSNDNLMAASS